MPTLTPVFNFKKADYSYPQRSMTSKRPKLGKRKSRLARLNNFKGDGRKTAEIRRLEREQSNSKLAMMSLDPSFSSSIAQCVKDRVDRVALKLPTEFQPIPKPWPKIAQGNTSSVAPTAVSSSPENFNDQQRRLVMMLTDRSTQDTVNCSNTSSTVSLSAAIQPAVEHLMIAKNHAVSHLVKVKVPAQTKQSLSEMSVHNNNTLVDELEAYRQSLIAAETKNKRLEEQLEKLNKELQQRNRHVGEEEGASWQQRYAILENYCRICKGENMNLNKELRESKKEIEKVKKECEKLAMEAAYYKSNCKNSTYGSQLRRVYRKKVVDPNAPPATPKIRGPKTTGLEKEISDMPHRLMMNAGDISLY